MNSHSKSQKGFITIPVLIAIFISTVIIGGGGYYIVHENSKSDALIENESLIMEEKRVENEVSTQQELESSNESELPVTTDLVEKKVVIPVPINVDLSSDSVKSQPVVEVINQDFQTDSDITKIKKGQEEMQEQLDILNADNLARELAEKEALEAKNMAEEKRVAEEKNLQIEAEEKESRIREIAVQIKAIDDECYSSLKCSDSTIQKYKSLVSEAESLGWSGITCLYEKYGGQWRCVGRGG